MRNRSMCPFLLCASMATLGVSLGASAQVINWPDGTPFVGNQAGRPAVTADGVALGDPVNVDDSLSRKTIADVPGEVIDPRTGELRLSATDLVVPGNGGMDIVVSRTRRGTYFQDLGATYSADTSYQETIADWRLDVPFVQLEGFTGELYNGFPWTAFSASPNGTDKGACAWPFNSPQFRGVAIVGMPGTGPKELVLRNLDGDAYWNTKYATNDHWIADCAPTQYDPAGQVLSQFVVHSPDGKTYYFDEPTYGNNLRSPNFQYLRIFLSKVVDRNGNWIQYTYDNSSFPAGLHIELRDYAYLQNITTSDGRRVDFEWEANPFCARASCAPRATNDALAGTGENGAPFRRLKTFTSYGRTWQFKYNDTGVGYDKARYLTSVVLPNAQAWTYAITPGSAATSAPCIYPYSMQVSNYDVTLPDGGKVHYGMSWRWLLRQGFYENGNETGQFSCWPVSAVQQRVVDDRVGAAQTTTWCYGPVPKKTRDADYAMWTWVLRPDRTETLKYMRELTNDERWKEGALVESQVRAPQAFCPTTAGDPGGGYLRKTTYEYAAGTRFSKPDDLALIPPYPWSMSRPTATSRTTIDQPDTGTFVASNADFDAYMMPQLATEQAADATARRWLVRYDQRNSAANGLLLGLVSKRCLVPTDASTDCPVSGGVMQGEQSTYSATGNLMTKANYGKTTSFTYFGTGDMNTAKDERSNTTTYSDYKRGIPRAVVRPESGQNERIVVDVNDTGTIHAITNARNNATVYTYDLRDRLGSVDYPIGADKSIAWSADGRTKTVTRGASTVISALDGFGRLVAETSSDTFLGDVVARTRGYDLAGHIAFESYASDSRADATGGTSYQYDALGRRNLTTHTVDGSYSSVTFSAPEKQRVRDFNGGITNTTSRSYGAPSYDQLLSTSTAVNGYTPTGGPSSATVITSFSRDALGFATQVTQGGVTRRYSPGDKHQLADEFVPELNTGAFGVSSKALGEAVTYNVGYCRDDAGNLLGKSIGIACSMGSVSSTPAGPVTDAICTQGGASTNSTGCDPVGLVFVNSYDGRSRLRQTAYQNAATAAVSYDYTPTDKVKKITKGGVVIEMDYDEVENLKYEIFNVDGYRFRMKYGYDGLGHLKSVMYPSGKEYQLAPDAFGRARSMSGVVTSADYYPTGIVDTISFANGEMTSMTPTGLNFVESIVTAGPHGSAVSLDYSYDNNGNVTTVVDGLRSNDTLTINYDELNRQTRTNYYYLGSAFYHRGYDATGNVLFDQTPERAMTATYDNSNRLSGTTIGGVVNSMGYDGFGNLVSDGVRSLTFDWAGDLASSQAPAQKTFTYDGRDRIIKRIDAQGTRYFVYSADKLMMEYSPSENKYTEYLYFAGQLSGSRVVSTATQVDSNGNGVKDTDEFHGVGWL